MVTQEDIKILELQDLKTLAQWWGILNNWQWPDELPNPESESNWSSIGRRSKLQDWIIGRIGLRECLREANKDRMTDMQFNDFWRGKFEGHLPSRERYKQRINEMIVNKDDQRTQTT